MPDAQRTVRVGVVVGLQRLSRVVIKPDPDAEILSGALYRTEKDPSLFFLAEHDIKRNENGTVTLFVPYSQRIGDILQRVG